VAREARRIQRATRDERHLVRLEAHLADADLVNAAINPRYSPDARRISARCTNAKVGLGDARRRTIQGPGEGIGVPTRRRNCDWRPGGSNKR